MASGRPCRSSDCTSPSPSLPRPCTVRRGQRPGRNQDVLSSATVSHGVCSSVACGGALPFSSMGLLRAASHDVGQLDRIRARFIWTLCLFLFRRCSARRVTNGRLRRLCARAWCLGRLPPQSWCGMRVSVLTTWSRVLCPTKDCTIAEAARVASILVLEITTAFVFHSWSQRLPL